ncbi:PX domain-containing protein [Aphelenchoides fujianensis]|nr:PX domain-containing protein [Aphelenchoides fujianensis]
MIHIAIPSCAEKHERHEPHKKFHLYDLYVNGAYHASVRYSNLYKLHEKLLETFGMRLGSEFPPKKVWRKMDAETVNKRREGLAKYFHGILQNADISKHPILERAFLDFQVDSFMPAVSGVQLDIHLPDGTPIHVECQSDDPTNIVMKKFAKEMEMDPKNIPFFGIFSDARPEDRRGPRRVDGRPLRSDLWVPFPSFCSFPSIEGVRWLKNFEAPFISQQLLNRQAEDAGVHYRLSVRKITWDPSIEEPLLDDRVALRLLYLQAANDLQRGVFCVPHESKEKLKGLQANDQWKQVCHLQSSYGYEILSPVRSDYPVEDTRMSLKIGRRQLVFEFRENGVLSQLVIKSTRIRVWRVSHNDANADMSFQIDYLVDRETGFRQITLFTAQAVLLSLFLQSVATEILHDLSQTSPARYKFNDELHSKVQENLQNSKAKSIVNGADLSIVRPADEGTVDPQPPADLFKIISHQMPFGGRDLRGGGRRGPLIRKRFLLHCNEIQQPSTIHVKEHK